MKVYKLTNQQHNTINNTTWGPNVTHTANGNSESLGNDQWIHFFLHPFLAEILRPTNYSPILLSSPSTTTTLWEAQTNGKILIPDQTRGGTTSLTTLKIIPTPTIHNNTRIRFAAQAAIQVEPNPKCKDWLYQIIINDGKLPKTPSQLHNVAHQATTQIAHISTYIAIQQNPNIQIQKQTSAAVSTASRYLRQYKNSILDLLQLVEENTNQHLAK